ncbi:hypothetical protein [Bradyrhizobium sp. URHC0002]
MLSWGKGFFRAWIVLSILWGAATVLIAKPPTYALLWNAPKYEIEFGSGRKVTLDTSRSHEDLAATLDDALQREPATSGKKAGADDRNEILDHFGMRYSTAGDRAVNAWLITVIPPAALLAFGIDLAWIFRGFRRTPA